MDDKQIIDSFVKTLTELYEARTVLDNAISDMDRLGIGSEFVSILVFNRDQRQSKIDDLILRMWGN